MMIKKLKIIVIGLLLFNSWGSFGQELLPTMHDTIPADREIRIVGNAFELSSALYNEFTRKFLFGGEIEDDLSEKTWKRQKAYNRLGGGYRVGLEYRSIEPIFKEKTNWSWMINLTNETHASAEYSDDFFGLVFRGNESFLGESAVLKGTSARLDQFWSIGAGIHDRKSKSFFTLNAVLPYNFFQAELERGTFTFSELGDEFEIDAEGSLVTGNPRPYFKGMGLALNFDFNIPFGDSSTFNGVISIQARNLGFYQIHKASNRNFSINESFSGFAIEDLTNGTLNSIMDTLGIESEDKCVYKLIPGFIQVGKIVSANSKHKVQPFFGARMYLNRMYKPMIYAGAHYQPTTEFSIGGQLAFGGYGNFRFGIYANYAIEKFRIGIGTEDLLGLILKSQFGHSALISIGWRF